MDGFLLCYKGICAFAKHHEEDDSYHGKIKDTSDLFTFDGKTLEEVSLDFIDVVNDYLDGTDVDPDEMVSVLDFNSAQGREV